MTTGSFIAIYLLGEWPLQLAVNTIPNENDVEERASHAG